MCIAVVLNMLAFESKVGVQVTLAYVSKVCMTHHDDNDYTFFSDSMGHTMCWAKANGKYVNNLYKTGS